jgi:hypothetical protein
MARDLTGILLPEGQLSDDDIRRTIVERGYGDVFMRVMPLEKVKLVQVEVHDAKQGLPCEDPELVGRLSKGGRAAFVHVNHQAKQAVVHAFADGQPQEGFAGEPDEKFEAKLREALAFDGKFEDISNADDGSRLGIGVASSRTLAVVRGAPLAVPAGTPTDFNSFYFHDRGDGLDEGGERMAVFAFDPRVARILYGTPGKELSAGLVTAPEGFYGPLEGLRGPVAEAMGKLGDQSPEKGDIKDVRALELCALASSRAFASGEAKDYWDERVLPMFALASNEPKIDADEVDDLDDCDSILHAVVEVLPFAAPPSGEGSLLASIGDDEIAPLAPWAKPGEEYLGSVFLVKPDRLFKIVRALDGNKLRELINKFERAWYRAARPGHPEGDAFETWRRAKAEEGQKDVERFVKNWTELRIVLELAAANQLLVGLLFYEGA